MRHGGLGRRFFPRRRWAAGSGVSRVHVAGARTVMFVVIVAFMAKWVLGGCDGRQVSPPLSKSGAVSPQAPPTGGWSIPLPEAEQRVCTAVAILIDTSGSMEQSVRGSTGGQQQKYVLAQEALKRIVAYTAEWQKNHTDRLLNVGIYRFSSSPVQILPMGEFRADQADAAVSSIGRPGGGTAIGEALTVGFKALYQSGCTRKHLVCITDGENTVGPRPDRIAQQLYAQTKGEVELHFVAFDTSAKYFGFLNRVNGHVVEAADGAQLQARLSEIYEKRILAEQMPAEK
ncbi:MAG TPA: vWA domain-containing protein [Phycisphaerae bacterium]|nr:vWA domain-containing protein [Phycisphaerae bacterium]HRY66785.1 vWA domain-containing protein [Phycisphaerae bacterium]HSA28425.1 vWA domain-containing protein [Phycisphaerae bacterium]